MLLFLKFFCIRLFVQLVTWQLISFISCIALILIIPIIYWPFWGCIPWIDYDFSVRIMKAGAICALLGAGFFLMHDVILFLKGYRLRDLKSICHEVQEAEDSQYGDVEPAYEELLNFLKKNTDSRVTFAQVLIEAVCHFRNARSDGRGMLSIDAIAYCMHELRWEEVLNVVLEEHRSYFIPRRSSVLVRLIEAFDDDWSEAEDYQRFSKPGKV
ncbi:hypothetical protein HA052_26450 [Chromobacterium haemolyticum]|uniref:DUF4760 domain-containing protein n=1 Tax=Chromobacterium fluminis TaxID=3044269 RepID=A0ABX0LIL9_9NEIS|nr:hypothetical protein [Chromobacterium haemolyticum]NHR08733.1 hypothetical protein [Chromobacterium haemolyticum]